MKKKIFAVVVMAAMLFSVAGCQSTKKAATETKTASESQTEVRVGSLQGPTSMGLVQLMKESDEKKSTGNYSFSMETQPDAIASKIVSKDLDVALVPANLASVLYNKTKGQVEVVDINTLGVLYCVTRDPSVKSIKDLANKTVYTTGQGASPEYVMNYLLQANQVKGCTLQFKSEATEVAAILAQDKTAIAILPQPFVTVAEMQNKDAVTAFSLTDAWDAVTEDNSKLVTGVTIVRKEFLKAHPQEVATFVNEHQKSVTKANKDTKATAKLIVKYGILEKTQIAKAALPQCNIVCIQGKNMQKVLQGYLNVLYQANPESVGGSVPKGDFYYSNR